MPVLPHSPKAPSRQEVLLHNAGVAQTSFVAEVLERFSDKGRGRGREDAVRLTLQVHDRGVAACGARAYDAAESKLAEAMDISRQLKQALQCTMEKE